MKRNFAEVVKAGVCGQRQQIPVSYEQCLFGFRKPSDALVASEGLTSAPPILSLPLNFIP